MSITIDDVTPAYYAGFFDSEGWVGVEKNCLKVKISNTALDMLQELQSVFGGHMHRINTKYPGAKECWLWGIESYKALCFLTMLAPYLRIKRAKAQACMEGARYATNIVNNN